MSKRLNLNAILCMYVYMFHKAPENAQFAKLRGVACGISKSV